MNKSSSEEKTIDNIEYPFSFVRVEKDATPDVISNPKELAYKLFFSFITSYFSKF